MDMPLVTTIITSYNKEKYISYAIESVLNQKASFKYDILIVDDCSTDASWNIIKRYYSQYNNIIKIFKNENNIGITKTWINICNYAKGKYIARLDGDDYWIDNFKLEKQIKAINADKFSKWINTDFNIINRNNNIIAKNCFKNKYIPLSNNFNDMLIKKGFTNASTWLVDKKLMLLVNSIINKNAVDDTFNIQLELLKHTNLHTIFESTTAYRHDETSDSTPTNSRIDLLYQTQLEFINKYNSNYKELLINSLYENKELEKITLHWKTNYETSKRDFDFLKNEHERLLNSKKYIYAKKIAAFINKLMFWKHQG